MRKLIGKGAFSEVFLLKEHNDSIFNLEDEQTYIVVKKINLIKLIEKYIGKQRANRMIFKDDNHVKTLSHQITPWQKNYMEEVEEENDDEVRYYKDKLQKLIQSEVDLLYNIYHYNIVKMYDYKININELKFEYVLKFEYMNYGDLYKILKSNSEPFEKYRNEYNGFNNELTFYIIQNIIEGLKFLHDLKIIHRDIKLHNILIGCNKRENITYKDFKVKISDLGFACINPNDKVDSLPEFLVEDLKQKWKKVCGTPYYMAPEIIVNLNGEMSYTKSCDIWSLGLTLYEMYFNVLPLNNINNINDIIKFFNNTDAQKCIDYKLHYMRGVNSNIKEILEKTLKIDSRQRSDTDEIHKMISNKEYTTIYDSTENLITNIIVSTDNNWMTNNELKESYIEIDKTFDLESWVNL